MNQNDQFINRESMFGHRASAIAVGVDHLPKGLVARSTRFCGPWVSTGSLRGVIS